MLFLFRTKLPHRSYCRKWLRVCLKRGMGGVRDSRAKAGKKILRSLPFMNGRRGRPWVPNPLQKAICKILVETRSWLGCCRNN
jgi:hypothetical protein